MELRNIEAIKKIHEIWKEYLANKTPKDYTTLYIHVPYCTQKCAYCEYFSKITSTGVPESCIDYLETQFAEASPYFKDEPIKALNFGGGTPNLLSPSQLDRILKMISKYWNLDLSYSNEMGFEFHPYHITEEHFDVLRHSYINRISMGIQSFNPRVIELEKRYYTSKGRLLYLYNTVSSFARMVNVDLLAGLFDQTSEILIDDVRALMNTGVESITIYELNRLNGRNNKESEREYVTKLLLDMYAALRDQQEYRYVGTTPEEGFTHCNRYYRKDARMFEHLYNPAPQGFNNVVAFSIDDVSLEKYPYSHFIPINKTYQRSDNRNVSFHTLEQKTQEERPWWKEGFDKRG